ncbi:unnamed protein product, partial [Polarella glacialis]
SPPRFVWAYESAAVTRVLPLATAVFVEPSKGYAARTLFQMRARSQCDTGCDFAFRYASAAETAAENSSSSSSSNYTDDCLLAAENASWQEIRPWGASPEARTPMLAGFYVVEALTRSSRGGVSRSCARVTVDEADTAAALARAASPEEAEELIAAWANDASRAMGTLRAQGQPETLALALHTVAREFPSASSLAPSAAAASAPVLQALFGELCEAIAEAAKNLGASEYLPQTSSRRLLSVASAAPSRPLEAAAAALLLATQALGPLLSLNEMWRSLAVCRSFLDQNAAFAGLLGGPDPSGAPAPTAGYLVAVLDEALSYTVDIANQTFYASERAESSSFVDALMTTVARLGDVVAAAGAVDSMEAPSEIRPTPRADRMVLSTKQFSGLALRTTGLRVSLPTQTIQRAVYPGLTIPALSPSNFMQLQTNVTNASTCLGNGANQALDRLALVVVQWGRNPLAVGDRLGSGAPSGPDAELISVRDVRLQSCGSPVPLSPDALRDQKVEMLLELPDMSLTDRRWGYGDVTPFRCVRWVSAGTGQPGLWTPDGCSSLYRAAGTEATGDLYGLAEGVLKCTCSALLPATWAVEIVPRPPSLVFQAPTRNYSSTNLVLFSGLLLWLPLVLPLLFLALFGDWRLALGDDNAREKLKQLLPSAVIEDSVYGDAEERLARTPWPLRCDLTLSLVATEMFVTSLCGAERRARWEEQTLELKRFRDMARAARSAGARVTPWQDPTSEARASQEAQPQRHQGTRRRAQPALPASPAKGGGSAVRDAGAIASTYEAGLRQDTLAQQPAYRDRGHEIDDLRNLFQDDGWEEDKMQVAKKPKISEQDWSQQVRGQVHGVGNQKPQANQGLPEGWIARKASTYGGQVYYVNLLNGKSVWEKPALGAVKALSIQEIRALLGGAADHVHLRVDLEDMLRPRIAERTAALEPEDDAWGGVSQDTSSPARSAAAVGPDAGWQEGFLPGLARPPSGGHGGQDRQMPQVPALNLRPERQHWAPPPGLQDDNLALSDLRATGLALEAAPHKLGVDPMPGPKKPALEPAAPVFFGDDGSLRLPLRYGFLALGPLQLFWACFLRRWPLTAVLLPRLHPSRLARVAALTLRLSTALVVATGAASFQVWRHVPTENVAADSRSYGELWADLAPAFDLTATVPLGLASALAGRLLSSLRPAFASTAPFRLDGGAPEGLGPQAKAAWWRQAVFRQRQVASALLLLALGLSILALLLAAGAPQTRASVAAAAFFVAAALELVAWPLLRSLAEAMLLLGASSRCCCNYNNNYNNNNYNNNKQQQQQQEDPPTIRLRLRSLAPGPLPRADGLPPAAGRLLELQETAAAAHRGNEAMIAEKASRAAAPQK